ncbi:3-hydroxyacyl-CoA dehydrogenase type-2-like isoform X2 [Euwallacea fornicatus]|uniref:3-hydroxyacyl-CoA dehydrogenase type-2-like isoform X2 n=1 Tax=Euwallacea fornicatus TaxID=995702 RepID=UPI0033901117
MSRGGASDPYGRATVEALLKDGARVIICDLPTKDLHIYGDEKAIFLPIDASQEEDMKTLISVIQDKYGKLDGIVNCIDHYKEIDVTKKEPPSMREFAEIVHENVLGPFNIARFLIPLLSRNIPKKNGGRGIIINMSSAAAFEGPKGGCAYAASKAAVIRMTEALSLDLQGVQIKCLSIITNYKVDDAKTINGLGGCFELKGTNGEVVDAIGDEPRRFAQLVKKVIESSAINDATLRLEKFADALSVPPPCPPIGFGAWDRMKQFLMRESRSDRHPAAID